MTNVAYLASVFLQQLHALVPVVLALDAMANARHTLTLCVEGKG